MIQQRAINELKVGSILTYLNLIISTIIPLLYTPVMLRMLGQEEYGLYSLSNSVIGYLSLLNLGMGTAVARYVTKCRVDKEYDKEKSIIGLFLIIYSVMAVVVCIVGFTLTKGTGFIFGNSLVQSEIARLKVLMLIMTVSTAVSFPSSVLSFVVVAYEKYIFRKLFDGVTTIALPIMNVIVLYMGYASVGMAIIGLILQIIYLIVYYKYCKKVLGIQPVFHDLPWNMLKEIFGFSFFILLSTLVDMLYWATDKILLGALSGTLAVAVYNIGGTFTSMLQGMSSAISGVFTTRVNTMVFSEKSMDDISELFIRIGRLQFLVVSFILSGYIVFGKIFLLFWAGKGYSQAYYVGLMTMIPLSIPLIQSIAYSTVVAKKKHQFRAYVYAIIAVLNILGTFWAIPEYGILGAAACTAIAYTLGNGIIMNVYYYKVIKLKIIEFWKNILRMSIVPSIMIGIGTILLRNIIIIHNLRQMILWEMLYAVCFGILAWKLMMNNYERNLFRELIFKILKRKGM